MVEAGDLDALVLSSRTAAPPFSEDFVRRRSLIDVLRSAPARLVTVTAPAGYGKTSLIAEWCELEDRETAWITLRSDDDPAVLMQLIARSCAAFAPKLTPFADRLPQAADAALKRIAPAIADALAHSTAPFVLFVDDVHTVRDLACVDALNVVFSGVPDGSQIVLSSRHRPAQYARGELAASTTRVTANELRLDRTGAASIARSVGARVDDAALGDWVEQCGGWAAGIRMCALLSRTKPFLSIVDAEVLSDYLYQACIRDLPDDIRRFLLRTSILPTHIPALCDAILERDDSALVLRDLEAKQLFVTADRAHSAYRLHPLFLEYLHRELELEAATEIPGLHRRAARWFQEHGSLPAAIDHLIAAGDFADATNLVAVAAIGAYEAGQVTTLARWIDEIGDANLLANPAAVVVVAWLSLLSGTDSAAMKWGTLLQSVPDDVSGIPGIDLRSAKAMVRAIMMRHGAESALVDAEYAVAAEPVTSSWRDPALQILGSTLLHSGREERGVEVLQEAMHTAEAHDNPATVVMCESELALLCIERLDWDSAAAHVDHALETIDGSEIDGYVMSAYAHAAAACVELQNRRRSPGECLLTQAMAERSRCMQSIPLISIPTRLLLIRAQLLVSDHVAARMLLGEIEGMLPPEGGREALDERIQTVRTAVQRAEEASVGSTRSTALTMAEMRVLPYLQTHLTRPEIAERLFVSKHTVISQMASIFRKLGASNRTEAVDHAIEMGLLGAAVRSEN